MIHIASHSAVQACANEIRRFCLLTGKPVYAYGPVEDLDLYVTIEPDSTKPLIGIYTESATVQWIVDDLTDHAVRQGTELIA